MFRLLFRAVTWLLVLASLSAVTGCTTTGTSSASRDPLENLNRPINEINRGLDRIFLRPVAENYAKSIPKPMQSVITNFYRNLGEPKTILNQVLQGKFRIAFEDTVRFVVNTTIGLAGFLDVATPAGLVRHKEDLGQTLAIWGFAEGPYLVLPFLGPTTLRDLPSRFMGSVSGFGTFTNPLFFLDNNGIRYPLSALGMINARVRIIPTLRTVEIAATDRYIYVREAYREDRQFDIFDGNPPLDDLLEDEFMDEDLFLDDEGLFDDLE